jgi:fucose 4-O-acetylase-like acetyltransferase
MFVAPFILWFITRGKAWVVAAASIGIWAIFHTTPLLLPFSSWELIFIPAMIVGYHLPTIEQFVKQLPSKLRIALTFSLRSVAGVTFATFIIIQVVLPMVGMPSSLSHLPLSTQMLFDKETIGIGRFALGVVWFWALYSVVRNYEHSINRATRGIFEVIGKKSLYTYGIHGFIIFTVTMLITPPTGVTVLQSTVFSTIILCVIYIAAISLTLAKWLDYQYHRYLMRRLLRYNQAL